MSHRTITQRMTVWLAVLMLVVTGTVSFALWSIVSLSQRYENLTQSEFPTMLTAVELGQDVEHLATIYNEVAAARSNIQLARLDDAIAEARNSVDTLIDELRTVDVEDAHLETVASAGDRYLESLFSLAEFVAVLAQLNDDGTEILARIYESSEMVEQRLAAAHLVGDGSTDAPVSPSHRLLDEYDEFLGLLQRAIAYDHPLTADLALRRLVREVDTLRNELRRVPEPSPVDLTGIEEDLDAIVSGSSGAFYYLRERINSLRWIDGLLAEAGRRSEAYRIATRDVVLAVITTVRRDQELAGGAERSVMAVIAVGCVMVALIAVGIFTYLKTRVTARLSRVHETIESAAHGTRVHVKTGGSDEISAIAQAFDRMLRDIEAREEALRASEANQRRIVEAAPLPIVIVNLKTQRVLFANRAASRLSGVSSDHGLLGIRGQSLLTSPKARREFMERVRRDGTIVGMEAEIKLPEGDGWALVSAVQLTFDDQAALLVAVNDITEQKQREIDVRLARDALAAKTADLADTARRLEVARQEAEESRIHAEEANRAKSEFLAMMSHELRTPLNAILGFSELIRDQAFGEIGSHRYSEYATDIHDSGAHLLELINDILDISKVEAQRYDLHRPRVGVGDFLEGAHAGARPYPR